MAPWVSAENQDNRYVNLVYPVRGRNLWVDDNLSQVDILKEKLAKDKFPATFLLQYDALKDRLLIPRIKENCYRCEFGIFLEVSEELATDSRVPYLMGEGQWYRSDKVFLSGYSLLERERMIDMAFEKFREKFGGRPKTIGVWYIDPYSLNYIVHKYGVTGYVSVADQFDTDGHRDWGKPWGVPFYPSKTNIIANANTSDNKLDVVELQWAPKDPTEGFGNGVRYSQASPQANDYINNGFGTQYFEKILDRYLNSSNEFGQIIVGLEMGQELAVFSGEHDKQLAILQSMADNQKVKLTTVSEFSDWYKKRYPSLSPITTIADETTKWINTPCYRAGVRIRKIGDQDEVFDLRPFSSSQVAEDFTRADKSKFLYREVPAVIDGVINNRQGVLAKGEEKFRGENLMIGDRVWDFIVNCGEKTGIYPGLNWSVDLAKWGEQARGLTSVVVTSIIDGKRVVGVRINPTTVFGWWNGRGVGVYEFPFQSLVRFKSIL